MALMAFAAQADDTAPVTTDSGAKMQPLWEIGAAGAVGTMPDYPGSDRYTPRLIPFPYFIYRGKFVRSDQNGARVRAQIRSNIELDVSGNASFGSHSGSSGPRAGMPKLDYLFELGPNLKITLARPAPGVRVQLGLPLRAVVAFAGLNFKYEGLVFAPLLGIYTNALLDSRWTAYGGIGPEWTNSRFQKYFYQVDPQYALPDRPAYEAHGGYLGSRLELGTSRKLGRDFRVFLYGRIDDYSGAENAGSPLYKTQFGYTTFAGVGWAFLRSDDSVPVGPAE